MSARVRVRRALSGLRRWWPDVFGGLVAFVYAMPSLWYPFARDQPIHWYLAQRLLEGELPYVVGVSTKPPGVFALLAAATVVFGDSMATVRIVDLIFLAITGWLVVTFRTPRRGPDGHVYTVPRRTPGELGAAWVAAAAFHYTFFDFSDTGHPELWQGVLMMATVWIVVRAPDGRVTARRAVAAGVLAMVAVTFKHVAFVTGVLAGALLLHYGFRRREPLAALRNAALFTLAVVVVLGLTLLPWVVAGEFDAFWLWMVEFILRYAGESVRPEGDVPPFLTYDHGLFGVVAAVAILYAGLVASFARGDWRQRRAGVAALLTFLFVFGSVVMQKRALFSHVWTYYFVTCVPVLALAVGWGLRAQLPRRGLSHLAIALVLMAGFFVYQPEGTHDAEHSYLDEHASFWPHLTGARSAERHHAPHRNSPLDDYNRLRRVAAYINARAQPGDTLCVDGFVMMLYQMTDMRCPSRFISGDGVLNVPEWHAEYRRMLDESPPTFIVTFGTRPRVRDMIRRGYVKHDMRIGDAWYTVLHPPDRR